MAPAPRRKRLRARVMNEAVSPTLEGVYDQRQRGAAVE